MVSTRYLLMTALGLAAQAMADDAHSAPSSSQSAHAAAKSGSPDVGKDAAKAAGAAKEAMFGPPPNDHAYNYAQWLICGLFGLAFVILVYRVVVLLVRHFRHIVSLTTDKQQYFRQPHAGYSWFKRNILYAPMFRKKHTTEMKLARWWGVGILPTRFQTIVLALVIIGNVFFCLYNIPFGGSKDIYLPLLRNRTGVAATVNCIPLVLFAARNNPFIWLLDISFDTYNLIHRWFGRMIVIEASVHVIAWAASKSGLPEVGEELRSTTNLLINSGTAAIIAFIIIPIQASSLLRHAFYETFLHIHQGLVITAFVGVWYHLKGLPEKVYIQAVIATWVIERLIRFALLVYRNFSSTRTTATVEALPGDAMRVTLHMARPWRMRTGQHLFLTVPSIGLWTSHPFSVAWSSEDPACALAGNKDLRTRDAEKGMGMNPMSTPNSDSPEFVRSADGKHTLSAIIRARSGFTGQLFRKASRAPQGKITVGALAEGPYGQGHTMASYGTVLLFAGGVGITHCLPYLRALIAGADRSTVATRRVTLVWTIQSPEHLEWIRPWMTSILAMDGRRDTLRIEIYITKPRSAREIRSPSSTVRMYAGRPKVAEIIDREADGSIGAMGVAVCGPGGLGDDVRQGVRNVCEYSTVDMIEESFSW